ncbi:leukotriene B4 receptor 1-like [Chanos chanos]|uniref:Leukotriene B4 receptor 1-like n=1 Tax=Chanos chanos TaxID=29144 RepID=A0A6J2UM89_CHACN|nr:leukotriene B4 receptor 1-like [Chanos chanos]
MQLNNSTVLLNSTSNLYPSNLTPFKLAAVVILGLCFLVGTPSNAAVIGIIARNLKNERFDFFSKLVFNLAVSGIISLLMIPIGIYALLYGWKLGVWTCKILFFVGYCSMYANVLIVTLIGIQRYKVLSSKIANRKALERLQSRSKNLLLIGLWSLSGVFASPVIFMQSTVNKDKFLKCQRSVEWGSIKILILLLEVLFGFIIPFSILLLSCLCLHKRVPQTEEKQRRMRLVVSVVVTFAVCWLPYYVINVIDIIATITETTSPDTYVRLKTFRRATGDLGKTLILINCCLNPFLYASLYLRKSKPRNQSQPQNLIESIRSHCCCVS